jgi:hypothetical protein
MRRTWWFASGDLWLPAEVRSCLTQYIVGSDTSLFYVSIWSLVHMVSGMILGWVTHRPLDWYLWLHTTWEVWQIVIGMTPIHTARGLIDVATDTVMGVVGFQLVR